MAAPNTPAKPTVTSPRTDIYPDFQWLAVGDPDLPEGSSEGITYDLELWRWDPVSLKWRFHGIEGPFSGAVHVGDPVTSSWMSGLSPSKYQVKVRSSDGTSNSAWSPATTFKIVLNTIDINKIFVSAKIDLVTGSTMRFWNATTYFLYKRCSFLKQLQEQMLYITW